MENLEQKVDRTVSEKHIQMLDARNIQVGRKNGTMIGTAADQKLAFYGTTPIAKQSAITAPSGGSTVDANARAAIDAIITALKNMGITS